MKPYAARRTDGLNPDLLRGIDSPVPGLAIVHAPCDCGTDIYGIMHVRSGHALFFSHSPENFGGVWPILNRADWTKSAADIEFDVDASLAWTEAFRLIPDGFAGEPAEDTSDLPGWEENL